VLPDPTATTADAGVTSGTGNNEDWVEKMALQGDKEAMKNLVVIGSKKAFDILSGVIRTNPEEEIRKAAVVAIASLDDDAKSMCWGKSLRMGSGRLQRPVPKRTTNSCCGLDFILSQSGLRFPGRYRQCGSDRLETTAN
jgi:hypothetical protein